VAGLAVRGKLIVVGTAQDPIEVHTIPLIFGGRSIIYGALTGTPIDEDTLAFRVLEQFDP
jgi:propanol-preferring alcohol dehydrogenase